MQFFEKLEMAPPDPLFGLNQAFLADPRPHKVNLGIGTYKTEDLQPLILPSVKKAEALLLKEEASKDYLPIDGDPAFLNALGELIFGEQGEDAIAAVQTVGGTGALRLGGAFLMQSGLTEIYLPDPTWDNHGRIFNHVGFKGHTYPYYNSKEKKFDFQALCGALAKVPAHSCVLLHACCHNPTGFDPSEEQWDKVLAHLEERSLFPLFDCAYQGFGNGLDEDVVAVRKAKEQGLPLMVAYSCSKNFGLYAERTGALLVHAPECAPGCVASQLKVLIRGLYSNPPCHGARIVSKILNTPDLRRLWESDLSSMRGRIEEMRNAFCGALQECLPGRARKFKGIAAQKGMFSYTGLDEEQVGKLRATYGIYFPRDGRINVAGLNAHNLAYVTEAIGAVAD